MPLCWKCRDTGAYLVIRRVDHGFLTVEKECECEGEMALDCAKIDGTIPRLAHPGITPNHHRIGGE